jgi:hypothetical protein
VDPGIQIALKIIEEGKASIQLPSRQKIRHYCFVPYPLGVGGVRICFAT